jgi:large subunit ribosomal protein L3
MRSGLITKKIGMSRFYDEKGNFVPVTILQLQDTFVTANLTEDKNGYNAIQVGTGKIKEKNVTKPILENFKKINLQPTSKLLEFRVDKENFVEVGSQLNVNHFSKNQYVDVSGLSIGKGFAGVIKRHNFRSLRASHGVSLTHRSHGSTGNRQDPGKVFKGKKMAGHLGNKQITTQNLKIIDIDEVKGLIFVKGSVPGSKNSWVVVKDSVKKTKTN